MKSEGPASEITLQCWKVR